MGGLKSVWYMYRGRRQPRGRWRRETRRHVWRALGVRVVTRPEMTRPDGKLLCQLEALGSGSQIHPRGRPVVRVAGISWLAECGSIVTERRDGIVKQARAGGGPRSGGFWEWSDFAELVPRVTCLFDFPWIWDDGDRHDTDGIVQ